MRASKTVKRRGSASCTQRETHISGAEGLFESPEIRDVLWRYTHRAINHPKGKPDNIFITVEKIQREPKFIPSLPVVTLDCRTPAEAKKAAGKVLRTLGISRAAMDNGLTIIKRSGMRGAALISAVKGDRLETDRNRGVRASFLGISKPASRSLSSRLSRHGINTGTVKEALILASKVISWKDVIAEWCVSDDPDYTTGYLASKKFGYIRIPNCKAGGSRSGGRIFFIREGSDMLKLVYYIERIPVIINRISPCRGVTSIDEILNHPNQ